MLREVQLDLVDPAKCKYVLQTVKSSVLKQRPARPQPAMTVLCAGPERGGRDACQVGKEMYRLQTSASFFHYSALHLAQFTLSYWMQRCFTNTWNYESVHSVKEKSHYLVALSWMFFSVFTHPFILSPGGLRGSSGMSGRFRQRPLGSAGCNVLGEGMWSELGKQQRPPPFQKRISRGFHWCQAAAALDKA